MAFSIATWFQWLSSLRLDELMAVVGGMILLDGPRYGLSIVLLCLYDWGRLMFSKTGASERFEYCPSVTAVLVGHNEADTVGATLSTVWGSYPRLEIIVVNDGSTDGMLEVAEAFAREHDGVRVFSRDERSGKASALNTALHYAHGEIIVPIDADSDLGPSAIWEIVQPLANPRIGAVSGAVLARNGFVNLVTRLEAYEYLHAIFMGRMVTARLGILGIVSGAFGAFRKEQLQRIMGWDVGHGEDSDLTLRLRKSGLQIAFAPYAQCFTNVPTKFRKLFKQRRRWNRGVIRHKSRKHLGMACFWRSNSYWGNFFHLLDAWVFRIACLFAIWGFMIFLILHPPENFLKVTVALYLLSIGLQVVQIPPLLFYSLDRRRDARALLVLPLMPFYQLFLRCARTCSILEEIFLRWSYRDNFYPEHVRKATWHW